MAAILLIIGSDAKARIHGPGLRLCSAAKEAAKLRTPRSLRFSKQEWKNSIIEKNMHPSNGFTYSGTDNLEAMIAARNYNAFLVNTMAKSFRGKKISSILARGLVSSRNKCAIAVFPLPVLNPIRLSPDILQASDSFAYHRLKQSAAIDSTELTFSMCSNISKTTMGR